MKSFRALILLVLAAVAGFTYGKAWWSFAQGRPGDNAMQIGLIGLGLLGACPLGTVASRGYLGRSLVWGAMMLAGYFLASW